MVSPKTQGLPSRSAYPWTTKAAATRRASPDRQDRRELATPIARAACSVTRGDARHGHGPRSGGCERGRDVRRR